MTVAPWPLVEVELFEGVPVDDAAVAKAEAERMHACNAGSAESYLVRVPVGLEERMCAFLDKVKMCNQGARRSDIGHAVTRADAAGCVRHIVQNPPVANRDMGARENTTAPTYRVGTLDRRWVARTETGEQVPYWSPFELPSGSHEGARFYVDGFAGGQGTRSHSQPATCHGSVPLTSIHRCFMLGDSVRVCGGALEGWEGQISRILPGGIVEVAGVTEHLSTDSQKPSLKSQKRWFDLSLLNFAHTAATHPPEAERCGSSSRDAEHMRTYDHVVNDRDCGVDMALHMCTGKGFEHRHVRIIGGDNTGFAGCEHKGKCGTVIGIVLFGGRRLNCNLLSWLLEWNRVMTLLTGVLKCGTSSILILLFCFMDT
ncbi:hypothetical protein B0H13DRAFT_2321301 [Mycena leptocephala]|nr:hypothetical protein B0H13DRAFT_2321301 [Mycena leptocephala]